MPKTSSACKPSNDGSMDPRIERILWHLEDDTKKNVIDEITFDLDLDEILEARDTLFENVTSTIKEAQYGVLGNEYVNTPAGLKALRQIAIPWKMIKRRVVTIAADDLCELYLYKLDPDKGFPTKMLKRVPLNLSEPPIDIDTLEPIVERDDELNISKVGCAPMRTIEVETSTPAHGEKQIEDDESDIEPETAVIQVSEEGAPSKEKKGDGVEMSEREEGNVISTTTDERQSIDMDVELDRVLVSTATQRSLGDVHSAEEMDDNTGFCSDDRVEVNKSPEGTVYKEAVGMPITAAPTNEQNGDFANAKAESSSAKPSHSNVPDLCIEVEQLSDDLVSRKNETSLSIGVPKEEQTGSNKDSSDGACALSPTRPAKNLTLAPSTSCLAERATHSVFSHSETAKSVRVKPGGVKTNQTDPHSAIEITEADKSQESFLKEINEIHQKTLSNSPTSEGAPERVQRVDKSTATVKEMATQTGPKEINDPPVRNSEFNSQMDYLDRALTHHERRLRANELRSERDGRKIDKIDADLFAMLSDMRESHEALIFDHNELKKVVLDLVATSPNYERLILDDTSKLYSQPDRPRSEPPVSSETVGTNHEVVSTNPTIVSNQPNTDMPPFHRFKNIMQDKQLEVSVNVNELTPVSLDRPARDPPSVKDKPELVMIPNDQDVPSKYPASKKDKGVVIQVPPSGQVTIDAKQPLERKRSETPIESFFKAAKKAITPNLIKRTVNTTPSDQRRVYDNQKRLTSTPSVGQTAPKPIELSNMFAVLDPQGNDDDLPGSTVDKNDKGPPPKGTCVKNAPHMPVNIPESASVSRENNAKQDQSWADIEDEDSRAIDVFLASEAKKYSHVAANTKPTDQQRDTTQKIVAPAGSEAQAAPPTVNKHDSNKVPSQLGSQRQMGTQRQNTSTYPYPSNNGARPKTGNNGRGTTVPQTRDPPRRIVTRNGWFQEGRKPPEPKKRKRSTSGPISYPPISGGQYKSHQDVFVRDLVSSTYNTPEEMSDAIQDYCEERGVGVFFIRIMRNQFDDNLANIKLTVAMADYETVVEDGFWPENVFAREWYPGKEKKTPE